MKPYRVAAVVAPEPPAVTRCWRGRFARADPSDEEDVGAPVDLPVRVETDEHQLTDLEAQWVRGVVVGGCFLGLATITLKVLIGWW